MTFKHFTGNFYRAVMGVGAAMKHRGHVDGPSPWGSIGRVAASQGRVSVVSQQRSQKRAGCVGFKVSNREPVEAQVCDSQGRV